MVGFAATPHLGGIFRNALRVAGHDGLLVDEGLVFGLLDRRPSGWLIRKVLGGRPSAHWRLDAVLRRESLRFKPSVVIVIKGAYVRRSTLEFIRARTGAIIANFSTDDPLNPQTTTRDLLEAIPAYDVFATPRGHTIDDLRARGARKVVHVRFGYDPETHFPELGTPEEAAAWRSKAAFVGTFEPDRRAPLERLAEVLGKDLLVAGSLWDRVPAGSPLRRSRMCGSVYGRAYRIALSCAGMALCFLRRANRDRCIMRNFEIPACGTMMVSERTDDLVSIFREDTEAVFFSSTEELVDKVCYYVRNTARREAVALAGRDRIVRGRHSYHDRVREILHHCGVASVRAGRDD